MTLIETLVATAVFLVFSVAIYQLYARVISFSNTVRVRTVATEIANEQFETIRNLQYYDVGTVGGIPTGVIAPSQTVTRNNMTFSVGVTIRNIDQPADGTLGGTPNDLSPADNKLVAVDVACTSCQTPVSVEYTSLVAPKSLETENGNGAIVIKAIDANGEPVSGASVSIDNTTLSPAVHIDDVTGTDGALTIVDAPPATESYHIAVSKSGYSSDQSYPPGGSENQNPSKPDLTVAANQVTQSTFSIDRLSTFNIKTLTNLCAPIGGIDGTFTGTKLIGTSPDVIKNTYSFTTDSSGAATLSNIEWDTYTAALSAAGYDLIGVNPLQPVTVVPNTSQNVSFVLRDANPSTLLVTVTDAATELPLADATVEVSAGAYDETKTTSVGSITQTDWSGGDGQADYSDNTKFFSADGGMDFSTTPGILSLANTAGVYVENGTLTSSTFNLGAPTTFRQISWLPLSQPPAAGTDSVRFQIATSATNDENTVWTYKGPDGTAASYYTSSPADIASVHTGDQFLRYRVFLSTSDGSVTPTISDLSFTYTSGCLPPGQIDFPGLSNDTYTVTVSKEGYATSVKTITINGTTNATFSLSSS